ncbi:MAG: hypothetical protein K2W78_15270 [Xanthobacteraceae bacterium]|nr:hypothetical protein [Xanthobacteraceae bacterium]
MTIHLFSPLHGWKEFLHEILVIFIGVLIALVFQQLVDKWRWESEVSNARETIHAEISYNLFALQYSFNNFHCRRENFKYLQDVIEKNQISRVRLFASSKNIEKMGMISPTISTETWALNQSSGLLAHMSNEEKIRLSSAYAAFDLESRHRSRA